MSIDAVQERELSATDVERYLEKHPEFFMTHPELVRSLEIPHDSGSAVSLLEHQVTLLRERNSQFHSRLDTLLEHAKENDRKFARTRRFVLAAISAQNLAELSRAIEQSLYDDFGVEACSFIVFSESKYTDVRSEKILDANRHLSQILTSQKSICGKFTPTELNWLFAKQGMKSAAIAPLQNIQMLGVLAVGNSDETFYRTGMGTLFLNYVSEVLAIIIPTLLQREIEA